METMIVARRSHWYDKLKKHMNKSEKIANTEKSKLLKESLRIVDKLGNLDIEDYDIDELEELIDKAKKLKQNRFWKL